MSHAVKEKEKLSNGTRKGKFEEIFSYTVTRSLTRQRNHFAWYIIEKGNKELTQEEKYAFSSDIIGSAFFYLKKHVLVTPWRSVSVLDGYGFNIYFKEELLQRTDSVKARGVIYTLLKLSNVYKRRGIITISTGNFAFVLCQYATKFIVPLTVVFPKSTPKERVDWCRQYSKLNPQITVYAYGDNMLEAHEHAVQVAKKKGLFYLDGNNHPNMIIGQATIAIEMLTEELEIDAVILPTTIDGCALTTAIATVIKELKSKIRVIEVQSEELDPLFQDVVKRTDSNEEFEIPTRMYLASPLMNLPNCVIDRVIRINQTLIDNAYKYLQEKEGYCNVHAAIGLAPIYAGLLDDLKGKRVVIPLYGRMDSSIDLQSAQEEYISEIRVSFSPTRNYYQ